MRLVDARVRDEQVDVEQRPPRPLAIGVRHGRHGVGDVVDRQELVGELELGHPAAAYSGAPPPAT